MSLDSHLRFQPLLVASPLQLCDFVPVTCGFVAFGTLEYQECGRSTDRAGPSIYPATEKASLFHAASVTALLLLLFPHPLAVSFKLFGSPIWIFVE